MAKHSKWSWSVDSKWTGQSQWKNPKSSRNSSVNPVPRPVDDEEALSTDTQIMHDRLINMVSAASREQQKWKYDIVPDLARVIDAYSLDGMFQHVKEIAVAKQLKGGHAVPKIVNKRIYIGPGRDDSSDDRIAVE